MAVVACQILFCLVALFLHSGAKAQSSGDLRLVGRNGVTSSTLTAGRLEAYYNGQWGTVCDDLFGGTEARVACRQLGFSDYVSYGTISTSFRFQTGSSSTPIWLDNLSCFSSDTRLDDCSHATIGSANCDHIEDVYVSCVGTGALRLGSFDSSFSGRLEVYFNGEWGTVCDDSFFQTEANVACRQLGYSSASNYGTAISLGFSRGTGQIWLDNVDCSTSDIMLSSCSHNAIGNTNCIHSEDVAVSCNADISDLIGNLSTAVIIGIVVAVVVPLLCIGVCILIICIAVCTGACCAAGASNRRSRNVTTTTTAAASTTGTAVVTTSNTAQAQAPYTPYGGYQPAPAAYPGQGQPYPAQGGAPPYPSNTGPGYAPPQGKPQVELDQYAAYPPPTRP